MKAKTKTPKTKRSTTPPAAPTPGEFRKCVAKENGHRSCHCGREGCGQFVTGR
jgi:hypothetical protein